MSNLYRACDKCRYDIDVFGVNECKIDEHEWQKFTISNVNHIYVMCCKCGKDEEYLWK